MPRPTAPQPPEHPSPRPPRRAAPLTDAQHTTIRRGCADLGVVAAPWLAWAEAAATTLGPDYATRLALLGAATEPEWDAPRGRTRRWRRR